MKDALTREQLHALFEALPDPVLVTDEDLEILAANPAAETLLPDAVRRLAPDHPLLQAADTGGIWEWRDARGEPRPFEVTARALPGGVRALLLRDTSDQARLREELAAQTLKDPLTGLLSLRGLIVALEPQVSRSRRYDSPLSAVALRLDGIAEEPALLAISRMLRDKLRWADLVARIEEDTFIVVLPETRLGDARRLIEKLHAELGVCCSELALRVQFGVVEWSRADSAQTLVRRATDAASPQAAAS